VSKEAQNTVAEKTSHELLQWSQECLISTSLFFVYILINDHLLCTDPYNAQHINQFRSTEYSTINIILASYVFQKCSVTKKLQIWAQ
jgi:hypothetical protein